MASVVVRQQPSAATTGTPCCPATRASTKPGAMCVARRSPQCAAQRSTVKWGAARRQDRGAVEAPSSPLRAAYGRARRSFRRSVAEQPWPEQIAAATAGRIRRPDPARLSGPAQAELVERGRYLFTVASCALCHGADSAGGAERAGVHPESVDLTVIGRRRSRRRDGAVRFLDLYLTAKRLELLHEFIPGRTPVAVVWTRPSQSTWQAASTAAGEQGLKLLSLEIRDPSEIEVACSAATAARAREPGESRSWPRRDGSPLCILSGSMSRPAG